MMKPSSGDSADAHELAAVKGKLSGALNRLISESSDDDLVMHLDQLKRMAVTDVARDLYEQQRFDPPPTFRTLAEELRQPDRSTRLPILHDTDRDEREGTILWDGQTLAIIARYKVGKTTLLLNLVRALADRKLFLDRFNVGDIGGVVGVWNYELPDWQWREWAAEHGIKNMKRVSLLHLRGYHVDMMREHDADWAVEWLRERKVKVWIIDTWQAALNGLEENDNTGAGDFFRRVQWIARRAGVRAVVWTAQQGTGEGNGSKSQARARGATALMDNVDAYWTYTSSNDERFLNATGRDVDYPEFSVSYDWTQRRLSFGEERSSTGAQRRTEVDAYKEAALKLLTELPTDTPEKSRQGGAIGTALNDTSKRGLVSSALRELDDEKRVHHTHGARNAMIWWIGDGGVERPCPHPYGECGSGHSSDPSRARSLRRGYSTD
jgi:hypothetical protein